MKGSDVRCDVCGEDAVAVQIDQNGRKVCGVCDPNFDLVRVVKDDEEKPA
jgi:formylmethanofuran dehydrogenase subunit E